MVEALSLYNATGVGGGQYIISLIIDGARINTANTGGESNPATQLFFERSSLASSGSIGLRAITTRTPNLLNIRFAKSIVIELSQYTATATPTACYLAYSLYK